MSRTDFTDTEDSKQDNDNLYRLSFENIRDFLSKVDATHSTAIALSPHFAMTLSNTDTNKLRLPLEKPILVEDARVGYVMEGSAQYEVNLMKREYKKGDIIYLAVGSVVELKSCSKDFRFSGFVFSSDLLHQTFKGNIPSLFTKVAIHERFEVGEHELQMFRHSVEGLWEVTQIPNYPQSLLEGYLHATLSLLVYIAEKNENKEKKTRGRQQEIFERFIQLVNQESSQGHTVEYYADKLCISVRYFATLVKKHSGATPKEWIDRSLVMKAKVMLRYSYTPVSTIADKLGFPTSSFFCKFFKQHVGCSPMKYRNTP